MTDLDLRAIGMGGAAMLAALVPPVAALRLALGELSDDSNLWLVALVAFFVACLLGGAVAARLAARAHLVHGAGAAAAGFMAAVLVGLIRRAASGDGILSVAVLVTATFFVLLAASLGVLGGLLARRRLLRSEEAAP